MKKYQTYFFDEIKEIEVKGETEKFIVLLSGRKESKRSEYCNWHDTWDDAHDFLINEIENKIEIFKNKINEEENKLEEIINMKKVMS
jgi:hypothetical protein